jgi:hypothetical protein
VVALPVRVEVGVEEDEEEPLSGFAATGEDTLLPPTEGDILIDEECVWRR